MSMSTGAPFKLVEAPGAPDGYLAIKYPGSLRYILARCDVCLEGHKNRYIVARGDLQQMVNYIDACGFDVYVPGGVMRA